MILKIALNQARCMNQFFTNTNISIRLILLELKNLVIEQTAVKTLSYRITENFLYMINDLYTSFL